MDMNRLAKVFPLLYGGVALFAVFVYLVSAQSATMANFSQTDQTEAAVKSCSPKPRCVDSGSCPGYQMPRNGWCPVSSMTPRASITPRPSSVACTQEMVMCPGGEYAPRDPDNYCLPKCTKPSIKPVPSYSAVPRKTICPISELMCLDGSRAVVDPSTCIVRCPDPLTY